METLIAILKETGIPFAYDHFAEGESPEPPFVCYLLPQSDNFAADGMVYFKASGVKIELYTDTKDLSVEKKLEDALDRRHIFYNRGQHHGRGLPELVQERVPAGCGIRRHFRRWYRKWRHKARDKGNRTVKSLFNGRYDFAHGSLNAAPNIVEHCSDRIFNAVHHT